MTNKEAAELRRQKTDLEKKRIDLKRQLKGKRSELSDEEFGKRTEALEALGDQIDDITLKLFEAPSEGSRGMDFMGQPEKPGLNEESYRSSKKYRDAYYRSFINGKIAQDDAEVMAFGKRAITSMDGDSVNSGGSYLVPQSTLDRIATVLARFGRVYTAINKYGFTGDVSLPIGSLESATTNANGTVTLKFNFTEVTINQQAIVANIAVPNLLLKNSISALEQYLAYEIAKYIGVQLDNYVLNGDPATSKFQGIITALKLAPSAAKTYTKMSWQQIVDIQAGVDEPYGDNATYTMKRATFFKHFKSLQDAEGRPLVTTELIKVAGSRAQKQYYIDGDPVIFTSVMPDTDGILFGDMDTYVINESQEMVIESDASEKFGEDKTAWRGKVYSGGKPMFAKSTFVYYSKA